MVSAPFYTLGKKHEHLLALDQIPHLLLRLGKIIIITEVAERVCVCVCVTAAVPFPPPHYQPYNLSQKMRQSMKPPARSISTQTHTHKPWGPGEAGQTGSGWSERREGDRKHKNLLQNNEQASLTMAVARMGN